MPPGFAAIPKTAPFSEEDVELLNRVVGPANAVQRAWLAGFLAGVESVTGVAHVAPAVAPQAAEPLTIVFASESGNSEKLASDMAKSARKIGLKPTVIDMAELELATLTKAKRLILIAATWGEGEPPGRAVHVYNELMSDAAPRLDGVEFGVLALGDTAYAEFCAIGKKIDERLAALGGKRAVDRVDCDLDFATSAAQWIDGALKALAPADAERGRVIAVDFSKPASAPASEIIEAEVLEHINLNSSRSDKETIHLALGFEAAPPYEPGASLDIYPENDSAAVDEILQMSGVSDEALRKDLLAARDITTLSTKTLETYAAATGHSDVKALLADGKAREWIVGRQLIDLIESFAAKVDAEQLRSLTRPLAPRAYSIASSRREVGDEAHLLVSAVRYRSYDRDRKGVASTHVADQLKRGQTLRVKLKPNKHFALPATDRDIIMVGPGTGIAPFRAFVQERRAIEAPGKNWLFFGDRSFTHDFLYQLEWQDALKDGSLTRMDVAFSRDTPEKVYVQHKMWAQRRDLIEWLENGAHFYVCGDAKRMAKDVRLTLVQSYADVKALSPEQAEAAVQSLEREKRYLQDVY